MKMPSHTFELYELLWLHTTAGKKSSVLKTEGGHMGLRMCINVGLAILGYKMDTILSWLKTKSVNLQILKTELRILCSVHFLLRVFKWVSWRCLHLFWNYEADKIYELIIIKM